MKRSHIILLAFFCFSLILSHHHVNADDAECISECTSNYPTLGDRPSACCGCCDSETEFCHETALYSGCCSNSQAFCGCISSRAFCSGSVYNSTADSSFGTCYDPNTQNCAYDPNPNLWIVCPSDYTPCQSNSFFSCCGPDEMCTSTISDSIPSCVPKTTDDSSDDDSGADNLQSSAATLQDTDSCLEECGSNYPYPSDRPAACCNCCDNSTQFCHEIPELSVCCQKTESFCGCESYRAYCSGGIWNSSTSVNTFGTCYDSSNPATASCAYEPSPNIWIICPATYSACPSYSFFSCCSSDEMCNSTISDTVPSCVPKTVTSTSASRTPTTTLHPTSTSTSGCSTTQCGSNRNCCEEANGPHCYNPNTHACVANDKSENVLCPAGGYEACGIACYLPSHYECINGALHTKH